MTNMRLKDVFKREKYLRENSNRDPESYLLFVHSYFPNNKKQERAIHKSYTMRHLNRVVQKFTQKNLKGLSLL